MPEYVLHILVANSTALASATRHAWCGESLSSYDWFFESIEDAVLAVQRESRQLPCPDCVKTIKEILK